jgi:Flp pilus assembly protein TadB
MTQHEVIDQSPAWMTEAATRSGDPVVRALDIVVHEGKEPVGNDRSVVRNESVREDRVSHGSESLYGVAGE